MESPEISSGNETVRSIKQKFEKISSTGNVSPLTFQQSSTKYQLSKHSTSLNKISSEIKLPSANNQPQRSMSSGNLYDKSDQGQICSSVKDMITQYEEKSSSQLLRENSISPSPRAVKYDSKHDQSRQRRTLSMNEFDFNMEDSERNGINGSNQDYKTGVQQTDDIRRLAVKVTTLERKIEDLQQAVSDLTDTIVNLEIKAFNGDNKQDDEKPTIIKRTLKLVNGEDN